MIPAIGMRQETAIADEPRVFLAAEAASPRAQRLALGTVLISAAIFFAVVPFAKMPFAHVSAFIATQQSALVICDLITAVLLFGQFNFLRSRAVLVLATGYLFTAFIAIAHALTYPDLYAPAGLLGAGPQTTAWLYFFWRGGFPLFVVAYALLKDEKSPAAGTGDSGSQPLPGVGLVILASVAVALALVCAITLAATAGADFLPVIMAGHLFSSRLTGIVAGFWALSFLALAVLWQCRSHTMIDVWLMVVMCAWICDMGLGAVFNTGRFDVGFYAGRMYGLLAASFVLIVLLVENSMHYAQLVQLSANLGAANKSLEQLSLHDGLTGLANRRFFDSYLADQIAVARRHKRTLVLVMCDVDNFKCYNDHYGHQAGDECLKQVAAALRSCCRRPGDMAARYGGEEFALILPETELAGATRIAEAAREAVAQLRISHMNSPTAPYISISGGIAGLLLDIEFTAQHLISAADQTLYQAKDQGRNRMVSVMFDA